MVSGFEHALAINRLALGQPNKEMLNSREAQVVATGELRRGSYADRPEYRDTIDLERRRVASLKKMPPAVVARLAGLRGDAELPLLFLELALRGKRMGRLEVVLLVKDAPLASENFKWLCTGKISTSALAHRRRDKGEAGRVGRGGAGRGGEGQGMERRVVWGGEGRGGTGGEGQGRGGEGQERRVVWGGAGRAGVLVCMVGRLVGLAVGWSVGWSVACLYGW